MPQGFIAKYFDPQSHADGKRDGERVIVHPKNGRAYVYEDSIILAVNVALATHRPLLIAGEPGTGKTTLAANVAHVLGWRFDQRVVTSRTKARDLMWKFDALRRIADAQAGVRESREAYIEPQALWWAFDPASAARRGAEPRAKVVSMAKDPATAPPSAATRAGSVVLLDEMDKAEPDVPNDLLQALDTEEFDVEDLDTPLRIRGKRENVLLCITTNQERELPAAFLRRCVVLKLREPTAEWLVSIANDRFGKKDKQLHGDVAARVMVLRETAAKSELRKPSTAEYLDAIEACRQIGASRMPAAWELIERSLLWKHDALAPAYEPQVGAKARAT